MSRRAAPAGSLAPSAGRAAAGVAVGGAPTLIAEDRLGPRAIAVGASSVYWINSDGTVMKAPR
ncbi:hypothetical protein WMF30_49895 [Sorangium sp. So ce134]